MLYFIIFVALSIIFSPLAAICLAICLAGYRKNFIAPDATNTNVDYTNKKKEIIYFVILAIVCYSLLAFLLRQSWIQGDEWYFIKRTTMPFVPALKACLLHYAGWVSRIGEIGAGIVGLAPSRWQEWILTPLFSALAPMAAFSLVRRNGDSLFSEKGRWFYVTAFILFLLAVYLPNWRNYWCHAAAWNYLYPSICLIYFLHFFRNDIKSRANISSCAGVFLIGVISGWGTECTSAIILPFLTCIIIYNLACRKPWLSFHAYCGYCGFLIGTIALFCSPALFIRSIIDNNAKRIDISSLTSNEYNDFIHNLDGEKLDMLTGSSGVVTLKDIPLFDRIFFWPFAGERFLLCCGLVLSVCILFAAIHFFTARKGVRLHSLAYPLIAVTISVLFTLSYTIQCIPTTMSYLPSGFAIVVACMFIFVRFKHSAIYLCGILVTLIGLTIFLPAGIQAAQYKHLDTRRLTEIELSKSKGIMDITLSRPSITLWYPTLGMIAANDIKPHANSFTNSQCAAYYGVRSVKQPEPMILKSSRVPLWIFPQEDKELLKKSQYAAPQF